MEYKWVVLTNTTLGGVIMSSINMYIVLISLPTIFRGGLNVNPFLPGEFDYLLWVLMGYSIVLASVLVTFGRISDLFGRTRLYTLGFIIFTVASVLLSLIPSNSGNFGALLLIVFRIVQAIGGGFLMVNSTALLTDAFPPGERGKALGLNQASFIIGSFLGIILGGLLSNYDWHLLFLVNVPFAIAGALWSIFKLKRVDRRNVRVKIDYWGNLTLALGLVLITLGFTYALMPYGNSEMGWTSPLVIASFIAGTALIIAFIPIELRQEEPLFKLSLFRVRPFTYGIMALFLSSLARGGAIMFLLTIWLQGIYLPLHGFSYTETPFWAGIYMLPMLVGTVIMAPIGGSLTDKYGARVIATVGMIIIAISLYLLTLLPYNFDLVKFESILFLNGVGNGLFASPNTTSIMNALHPRDRGGAGNGMRQTFSNVGSTISMAMFFTIAISIFSQYVPIRIHEIALSYELPSDIANTLASIPASSLLFATFLGMDPVSVLPSSLTNGLPTSIMKLLDSNTFLPSVLGPPFMMGLRFSLYISIVFVAIGAVLSYMRGGGRYVYEESIRKGAYAS
ncbi:MFS transporter [Vulcanisaeta souniana]|uniref:MFS transporter n=1 Tax=Vulcanisaeta souniana TaxID=164452 RepID=UPI0006D25308|nr:MFS transporter [Vulcanisaeta souniana]